MNNSNRPGRSGLTPEQERRRAEWQRYAAEEQARRQAAMAARRRAEAEYARRAEAERRAQRAENLRIFKACVVLYLIALVLMLVVGGVCFWISLHRVDAERLPDKLTYTVGGIWDDDGEVVEKPLATITQDYGDVVRGETVYLPMTALAELAGLRVTGSPDIQKFTTPDGEYVRLTANSATAEVNGEPCTLDGPVLLLGGRHDETVWVPVSFVEAWMAGVCIAFDDEAGSYAISLDEGEAVAFLLKGGAPLAGIDETAEFGDTPPVEFKADLSAYESYMNPADRDAYVTLINVAHKLDASYLPADLTNIVDTRKDGRNTQRLRLYAAKALEAFFIEMRACGINDVSVTSGYRSYEYQTQLFNQQVAKYPALPRAEAEAKAATVVAIPGSSEHQSGLCIDMHNLASADVKFGQTAAFDWLSQNAHKFGFILRFPEDKVAQTGISYEPWHYRYVGRYHATRIYESGLCLEEYVEKYGLN